MSESDSSRDKSESGRIVAAYGRRALVEDEGGERRLCLLSGSVGKAVCGDYVQWDRSDHDRSDVVRQILPRQTALSRPDTRGRVEVIAANVTQVIPVLAVEPAPDAFLVDRYLAAAALMEVAALIVANKSDLGDSPNLDELTTLLSEYRRIGYRVLTTSAITGAGIAELERGLQGHTSILVGQSGAGKSSLLNTLLPGIQAKTAALSRTSGEGRHTTTAFVLHHLPSGGEIIDSPGVRDFSPPLVEDRQVDRGFLELSAFEGGCRFSDCLHLEEPGCAMKTAVEDGSISRRRYKSYRDMVSRMRQLRARSRQA